MQDNGDRTAVGALSPLPYHESIREYLKTEETEIWRWYTSNRVREEHADTVRFELLKSTYRVDRETQPEIYTAAESVVDILSLDVPITIYQAQNPNGLNASLAFVPNEAHVVLHGPISSKLDDAELQALLAHELSHLVLWQNWGGEYLVVDQILAAMTLDRMAEPAHFASARLFRLYNEIFCDRGSLAVTRDPLTVVAMLLKVGTTLTDVSAESYMRQAEEIFSTKATRAADCSHPEAFIRARAVKLFNEDGRDADPRIVEMIEGQPALDELDLLSQQRAVGLTRRLIDLLLAIPWMQTDAVMAHAKLFFEDYAAPEKTHKDDSLANDIKTDDQSMRDYYCFVLLDFVTSDRDLEELPLAAALSLAEQLDLKDRFFELTRQELRLRKKQLQKIYKEKERVMAKADGDATAS